MYIKHITTVVYYFENYIWNYGRWLVKFYILLNFTNHVVALFLKVKSLHQISISFYQSCFNFISKATKKKQTFYTKYLHMIDFIKNLLSLIDFNWTIYLQMVENIKYLLLFSPIDLSDIYKILLCDSNWTIYLHMIDFLKTYYLIIFFIYVIFWPCSNWNRWNFLIYLIY